MNTYKATVRVRSPSGSGKMVVWVQTSARSSIDAKQLLEVRYGRGNVISLPTRVD